MSLLSELGLRAADMLAGFWGGVTAVFVHKATKPVDAVGLVIAGTMAANYLAEPASKMLGISAGAAGFIVGLTSLTVCSGILNAARAWRPRPPGGQG